MIDRRGYKPPWGRPQSVDEFNQIHRRWAAYLTDSFGRTTPPFRPDDDVYENGQLLQCGGCSYYVPIEGGLGADWGACTNPSSEHDRTCVFEHFGCLGHSIKSEPAIGASNED